MLGDLPWPKPLLKRRVEQDLALVVFEQIELDLLIPFPTQQRVVQSLCLGSDQFRVRAAAHVLTFVASYENNAPCMISESPSRLINGWPELP